MEMRRRVKEKKMLEPTGMGEEASMSVFKAMGDGGS
jgi:hypothetical protein